MERIATKRSESREGHPAPGRLCASFQARYERRYEHDPAKGRGSLVVKGGDGSTVSVAATEEEKAKFVSALHRI